VIFLVSLSKLIIVFPPAKHDFPNCVLLNAFASEVATSAVIVGHSSQGYLSRYPCL